MVFRVLILHTCMLVTVATGAASCTALAQQPTSPPDQPQSSTPTTESPSRLTISVSVSGPEDLKVKEGDRIKAGDLIADRGRERQRLDAQKRQLQLALTRLQSAIISPPQPPSQVPSIAVLPSSTYLEESASIERAKVAVDQAERSLAQKQQEIDYLQSLAHLDPLVLEHEQAKLIDLQQAHTAAVRDYQLAVGRMGKAQDDEAYREYQHTLAVAERVEQSNQAAMDYQRQWAEYEQRLRDRDFQVAQTQLRLDEVETAIATLSTVRSPYAGRVRRVKWLGQGSDGSLSAEVTLLVQAAP
jgi:hypothetical protein